MTLNGTELPKFNTFKETQREVSATQTTITGKLRRDVFSQKRTWTIKYDNISRSEIQTIIDLYELQEEMAFVVDVNGFTINATVLMSLNDIDRRWSFGHGSLVLTLDEV